jgi:hypothetical protein
MVDVLNRGILRKLLCSETTVTPEVVETGKILLLDLPIMEFARVGQLAQAIWKYSFQRSISRRNIANSPRPVFLWADEAQYFLTSHDMMFQSTCRSYRVATVLLSQNVSNFYAVLGGGEKARSEADSLFGNLNTKICHANGDSVTNEWAAKLIGQSRQFLVNANNSYDPSDWMSAVTGVGRTQQTSSGISESYQFEVQPCVFTTLRTGGYEYNGDVDAIVIQNGKTFRDTSRTWRLATFQQTPG